MAANFLVTASMLETQAEELENLNQAFKGLVEDLVTTEGSLNSMWEGEAREAFRTNFNEDRVQMENFYALIEKYIAALNKIASNYHTAETVNRNVATTRTHG